MSDTNTQHPTSDAQRPTPNAQPLLLTIIYDSGMDERVTALLEEQQVTGWTKVFDAHGTGGRGRKLNTPVWPGTAHILYVVQEIEESERLIAALQALKRSYRRNPGLTIWTQSVQWREG